MVELIVGVQGTGKTKMLIDLVNKAVETSPGNVVCIEKGKKLRFDIKHTVRLTNTEDYDIKTADSLYGLVCGLYAENYDITHVFIDSALKICNKNIDAFEDFVKRMDEVSDKNRFKCIMTSSIEKDALPESIKKYVME
jgi:hypothetical protein